MTRNQKEWESVSKKSLKRPGGTSIVKAAGCMGCWYSKSIPMTRVCALPHPAMRAL
nr:sporulation killing factor [Bacillus safensis]